MTKKVIATSLVTATILLSGCASNQPDKAVLKPQTHTIKFSEVKVPTKEYEKEKSQLLQV